MGKMRRVTSASRVNCDVCADDPQSDSPVNQNDSSFTEPEFIPRLSARSNKGIPPLRYVPQWYYAVCSTCCRVLLCFMPRRNYCIFLPLAVAFSFIRGGMRWFVFMRCHVYPEALLVACWSLRVPRKSHSVMCLAANWCSALSAVSVSCG